MMKYVTVTALSGFMLALVAAPAAFANSRSYDYRAYQHSTTINQENRADFENTVHVNANTGSNYSKWGRTQTGNVDAYTTISNDANHNYAYVGTNDDWSTQMWNDRDHESENSHNGMHYQNDHDMSWWHSDDRAMMDWWSWFMSCLRGETMWMY